MDYPETPATKRSSLHAFSSPLELVCVYAREDEQYFRKLQRHFYPWVRQQKISWLEISAGEEVGATMQRHLKRAEAILLLLSPDFLAEDATYRAMLTALAENERRQVPVILVLARPSSWKESECRIFQAFPDQERPVTAWDDRDEAYENIRQGFLRLFPVLQTSVQGTSPVVPHGLSTTPGAADFRARDLPGEYVARSAVLARIKSSLLNASPSQTTALRGAGGFGKTTLALALCHDPEIQAAFPDGVLWIEMGDPPPRPLDLLNSLLARLIEPGNTALALEEALGQWRTALEERTCLLVIDDVWQQDALAPLLEGGPRCRRLVTTRNDQVLPATASRIIVDAMEPAEALALLCQGLPVEVQQPDVQTASLALVKRLGYWPYLLTLARGLLATHLRYGRPLKEALVVVEQVYQAGSGISWQQGQASGFYEAVESSLQASFRQLQRVIPERYQPLERLQELAIFPEDTDIPIPLLRLFWQAAAGLQSWEADHLCMQLHSLSLLLSCDLGTDTIRLHDVTRAYLVRQASNQLPQFHARFLDSIRQGLNLIYWAEMPLADSYLWQYLLFHLCQAEHWSEVAATLADLRFLTVKAYVRGVTELEGDLERVMIAAKEPTVSNQLAEGAIRPELTFLPTMRSQVRLISHLLRQSVTLEDMTQVALLDLGWRQPFVSQYHLLEQFLPRPYLTVWHPFAERPSPALLRSLTGHTGGVRDCVVSEDGDLIVSASSDGTLKVWNALTGAERFTLKGHTGQVFGCAMSRDGRLIVSASADHTLKVWDAATGEERFTLKGHTDGVRGCAVSRDGHLIVSASRDHTLKLWDAATGDEQLTLKGHTDTIYNCVISEDKRLIISASRDRTLRVWDAATGKNMLTLKGHTDGVRGCAISKNGHWIVSASRDRTLKVWNVATGEERFTLRGHTDEVLDCLINANGDLIVSASSDRTLKVWDSATGEERRSLKGHTGPVRGCSINGGGDLIVSASADRTLKLWDATLGEDHRAFPYHIGGILGCAVSGDGRLIVSASHDRTLKVWGTVTGEVQFALKGHTSWVLGCAVSGDGRLIVSASRDRTLKVWDAATGAERLTLKGHTDGVRGCVVSGDGSLIVSASYDCTLKVWDAVTGKQRFTFRGHTEPILGCAMSGDGKLIVSASSDGTLKVWDSSTGEERCTLKGHSGPVTGCAMSGDGHLIVSGLEDRTLAVWDTATGEERSILKGHTDRIYGCAVSKDGRLIVSVSRDGILKVWDAVTGRCVLTSLFNGALSGCAFHPDGEHLVACGDAGLYFSRLVM